MNTQHLTFGPFEFITENGCPLRDNRPVAIGARGASLLAVLLAADGRVVTKSALMDAVAGCVMKGACPDRSEKGDVKTAVARR